MWLIQCVCVGWTYGVCVRVCVFWFYCNFRAMIDCCNHLYAIYEHKRRCTQWLKTRFETWFLCCGNGSQAQSRRSAVLETCPLCPVTSGSSIRQVLNFRDTMLGKRKKKSPLHTYTYFDLNRFKMQSTSWISSFHLSDHQRPLLLSTADNE